MTRMQSFSLPRTRPNRRNASSLKQDRVRLFTKVLDLEHKEHDGMRDFVIFAMLKAKRSMSFTLLTKPKVTRNITADH